MSIGAIDRNITGDFKTYAMSYRNNTSFWDFHGAFYEGVREDANDSFNQDSDDSNRMRIKFDASMAEGVFTDKENRPCNIALLPLISY